MMNEVPRMKGKQMVKTTFKALTVKHKPRIWISVDIRWTNSKFFFLKCPAFQLQHQPSRCWSYQSWLPCFHETKLPPGRRCNCLFRNRNSGHLSCALLTLVRARGVSTWEMHTESREGTTGSLNFCCIVQWTPEVASRLDIEKFQGTNKNVVARHFWNCCFWKCAFPFQLSRGNLQQKACSAIILHFIDKTYFARNLIQKGKNGR